MGSMSVEEAMVLLAGSRESSQRVTDALEAWVNATPEGMTADEVREAVRRFAAMAETLGPRRGLSRFARA